MTELLRPGIQRFNDGSKSFDISYVLRDGSLPHEMRVLVDGREERISRAKSLEDALEGLGSNIQNAVENAFMDRELTRREMRETGRVPLGYRLFKSDSL